MTKEQSEQSLVRMGWPQLEFASIWVRFGFVFKGRVIVFNNLLASFVQITSFLYGFCLPCGPCQGNFGANRLGPQPRGVGRGIPRGTL